MLAERVRHRDAEPAGHVVVAGAGRAHRLVLRAGRAVAFRSGRGDAHQRLHHLGDLRARRGGNSGGGPASSTARSPASVSLARCPLVVWALTPACQASSPAVSALPPISAERMLARAGSPISEATSAMVLAEAMSLGKDSRFSGRNTSVAAETSHDCAGYKRAVIPVTASAATMTTVEHAQDRPRPARRPRDALGRLLHLHQDRRRDDPAADVHRGADPDRRWAALLAVIRGARAETADGSRDMEALPVPGRAQQRHPVHADRLGGADRGCRSRGDPEFVDADLHLPADSPDRPSRGGDLAQIVRRHRRDGRHLPDHRLRGVRGYRPRIAGPVGGDRRDDQLCGSGDFREGVQGPRSDDAGCRFADLRRGAADPLQA